MKPVTVPTKDVSPSVKVKTRYRKECGYKRTLQDGIEDYIKKDLMIDG